MPSRLSKARQNMTDRIVLKLYKVTCGWYIFLHILAVCSSSVTLAVQGAEMWDLERTDS